jgi:hypothetical protein
MSERIDRNEPDFSAVSNAIHLNGRQWIGVGLFAIAMILLAPIVWQRIEPMKVEPDYRMPYELSEDYWLYDRLSRLAASDYDTVLLGDSVVWGQYVTREQTLSHYLNEQAGQRQFANLGLNGAYPVALAGLIEQYAQGIRDRNVIVQCNPLWLSSPRHDLQTVENVLPNHLGLLPQFVPNIPAYPFSGDNISKRIGVVVEQRVPFSAWTGHLQQAYFDRTDIPSWTMDHPYENPLKRIEQGLPPSDNALREEPISWFARGITKQDFNWVDLETSIQWRFFRRAVEILRQRDNRVFVLLGPFNEHMLTEKGLDAYQKVRTGMETWLRAEGIAYWAPPALASEQFADASHPLSIGYATLARDLLPRLQPPSRR